MKRVYWGAYGDFDGSMYEVVEEKGNTIVLKDDKGCMFLADITECFPTNYEGSEQN